MTQTVDYTKLMTHVLQAHLLEAAKAITLARACALQRVGAEAQNDAERHYLRLYQIMESRGLRALCPTQAGAPAVRPPVQQQQSRMVVV